VVTAWLRRGLRKLGRTLPVQPQCQTGLKRTNLAVAEDSERTVSQATI